MEVEHYVKFRGEADYEMYQMTFRISDADLPEKYKELSCWKKMFFVQYFLLEQGIVFRMEGNDITMEEATKLLEKLRGGWLGTLVDKIKNETDKTTDSGSIEEMAT